MQIRGGIGGLIGVTAMIVPTFCVILVLGFAYRQLAGLSVIHFVLAGVAAVGAGVTFSVGVKVTSRLPRQIVPLTIACATFAAVGIFRMPMLPVVLVAVPLSVAAAYIMPGNEDV